MIYAVVLLIEVVASVVAFQDDCIGVNKRFLFHPVDEDILREHCIYLSNEIPQRKWTASFSTALILNDIAPFTVLTENPFVERNRRKTFTQYLQYILKTSNCDTVECISRELNTRIWSVRKPAIIFEPAAPNQLNSYSVNETWTRGNGSCTSMSVFLITGLRLLGVPARIAGTPHWNLGPQKCPLGDASDACGNHNWVEVFVPGKGWSFIDQRRPDQVVLPLNHSWFYPEWTRGVSRSNQGNHSIYAASFIPLTELDRDIYPAGTAVLPADHFPLAWDWRNYHMPAWDVSESYQQNGFGLEVKYV